MSKNNALVQAYITPELRERLKLAVELEGTTIRAVISGLIEGWVKDRASAIEDEARRRLALILNGEDGGNGPEGDAER